MVKTSEMFTCFDTIHEHDRHQMDRQTDRQTLYDSMTHFLLISG